MPNEIDRKFKILSIVSLSFFLVVGLINYFIPKLEFNKPEYNRAFGIFFNLYCFYIFVVLLKLFLKIKTKVLKIIAITLNLLLLLIALLNFPLYLMKIDPQIQYYDVEVKYFNKRNKLESITSQYRINWKNNKKIYQENRVYDIGPFRYFIEYDIDSSKLNNDWEKVK
ncbi:hypothetical protein [Flavobacterium sp.]|uniref:hypothetical protein n=1 Tax=Flavobacterium sp. TaxID=239 RepID=UPI003D6A50B5